MAEPPSISTGSRDAGADVRVIGRYALHTKIASGGMATVHVGRLLGPIGFARTVAIKRLHPHYAAEPDVVSMFIDEARIAARIRHPNVVQTLDAVALEGELFLVMEYVPGESLAQLARRLRDRGERVPPRIVSSIMTNVLHGLHAAHEATDEHGQPLGIVHRDVSPQNILVGADGVARVLDFGVAKAVGRLQTTRDGQVKGKLAYMAPEQFRGNANRQTDIYAAGVVLWETLAGRRLFQGENDAELVQQVLLGLVDPPSKYQSDISEQLDALTTRAMDREISRRFDTAREMALALERCIAPAPAWETSEWVHQVAKETLAGRAAQVAAMEQSDASVVRVVAPTGAPTRLDVPSSRAGGEDRGTLTVTQPSSLSVSSASKPARRWRTRGTVLAMLAVLGCIVATFSVLRRTPRERPAFAASVSASSATASAAAPPPSTASDVAPAIVGSNELAATSASAPPPQRPAAPASRGRSSATAPAPRPPAADCAIPYTFDASGRKIYKRNCL